MKTRVLLLVTALLFFGLHQSQAQGRSLRVGYIDMDYILENVPEYKEAETQLNGRVQKWKSEIEQKMAAIEDMQRNLDNERALLTKELIEEREEDIKYEREAIYSYQQDRFGPEGDLMIQKRRLVQPVQDQVFAAVQEISEAKKYDFVFEKSNDLVMLFAAERHDISDQILRSINRAAKRKQVSSKKEKEEVLEEEYKSVEEAAADEAKEQEIQEKKNKRETLIEERKRQRDSIRDARKAEYEARRAKLLEERQRRKDSILEAREKAKEERENGGQ